MYLLAPIIVQNLQKIVRVDPKLLGRFIFVPINSHLAQIRLFSEKPLVQLSCTSWSLSLSKSLNHIALNYYTKLDFEGLQVINIYVLTPRRFVLT